MPTVLQFRRGTEAQNDAFTGLAGEISVDTTNGTLRVHDGSTAGGSELVSTTATQFVYDKTIINSTFQNPSIDGHLIPSANVTHDLGSSTAAWRDLYLSGNTINLGGATISFDESNGFQFLAGDGNTATISLTTDDVAEGTSLYYTTARANTDIDARVTQSFVNALNVDADTLDGANGAQYLDYTNFTNTPTIPSSGVDFDPVGTDNSTDVTLAGSYDYLTIIDQQITLGQVDATTDISGLATVATSGSYSDLSGTPTNVSAFTNDAGYLTTEEDTTYDLVSPGSGVLRLSDDANSNDDITFVGSGATSVSSNATHIIVSSTDNNTTYTAGNNMVLSGTEFSVNATPTFSYTDLTPADPGPAHTEGRIYYNDEYKALTVYSDISDVSLQVGLEEWTRAYNDTGNTIPNGTPVYATGAFGEVPTIAPADATTEAKARVLGIATHDIADSSEGFVTTRGLVSGIDTSNLTSGQPIHLGADGSLQNLAPTYPYYAMNLGQCVVSSNTNGYIYVTMENHTFEQFRVTGNQHVDGNLTIEGNFTVNGTQSIVSQNNLSINDSFVYLNTGDAIGESGTTFTGSGLDDAYFTGYFEGTDTTTYYVRIDGVGTGTAGVDTFEWSKDNFSTTEATGVDITGAPQELDNNINIFFNATTGHTSSDVWSGTASPIAVDTGWSTNRNTGNTGVGYTHMGVFFDVSDDKFKFFDEYDPEPSGTIDTGDASFSLGTVVAAGFEGTATNSTQLNGEAASYYLNYNNFVNTPTLYTTANANTDIDARVTKSFVDALNVDADTLDGNDSTYFYPASNPNGYTTNIGDITGVTAGSGISGGGTSGTVTINHADTSSQPSVNNTGATVIQDVTLDTYGHVTGLASKEITPADIGAQVAGTYNTVIGTDTDLDTSGSTIIDNIFVTDGVITSMGTRTLTAADIGAQAAGTYNTVIGTDTDINTSGSTIVDNIQVTDGVITSMGTRTLTAADIGAYSTSNPSGYTTYSANQTLNTNSSPTFEDITLNGMLFADGVVSEDWVDLGTTTSPGIDLNAGAAFFLNMSGTTTFTMGGGDNNWSQSFIVEIEGNGSSINWPNTVDWAGGTAPDAPSNGQRNIYAFWSRDGGTTYYGFLAGEDMF